jgi:hypothetical protein
MIDPGIAIAVQDGLNCRCDGMSLPSGILSFLLLTGEEVPNSPLLPRPYATERRHTSVTEAIVDGLRGECFDLHCSQASGNAALDGLPRLPGSPARPR